MHIKLGLRRFDLSPLQVVIHIILLILGWGLFIYLVREAIRIEGHYIFHVGAWIFLLFLAFVFAWIAFVAYWFRHNAKIHKLISEKAITQAHNPPDFEVSTSNIKRMKFIDLDNSEVEK